jgi:site-specific recombinase XerD
LTRSATRIDNRALLILLYRSGLRIIEALVFLLADLNMAAQSARLRQTKSGKAQTRG